MKLRITVEGRKYDVEVEVLPEPNDHGRASHGGRLPAADPEVRLPDSFLQARPPSDVMPDDRFCRSPIAGLIVSVAAMVGQKVRKDEPLVTIEAMKMQSAIGAPIAGVIQNVNVAAGDTVKSGQVLVELA